MRTVDSRAAKRISSRSLIVDCQDRATINNQFRLLARADYWIGVQEGQGIFLVCGWRSAANCESEIIN